MFSIYDKQILNVKNDSEEVEYVSEEYNSSNRSPISQDDIEMDNSLEDLKLKLENLPKFENLEDLRLYPSPENDIHLTTQYLEKVFIIIRYLIMLK